MTRISAVFVARNGIAFTKQCVNFLRIALEGISHEIIAVDNGSMDDTKEWLAGQEDIKLIRNDENLGLAAAWNQGKRIAEGEAVLFFHNDIIFSSNSVRIMLDTLFSRPDIGMVGPFTNRCFYRFNQGVDTVEIKTFSDLQNVANQVEQTLSKPHPVLFLESFCVLVRKDVLDAVGDFDEQYFPVSFEDADFGLRLRKAGYSSVLAGTYVHHCEGGFSGAGISYHDIYKKNEKLFYEKWGILPRYSMIVRSDIMQYIDNGREAFSVLDVGCACGANLMWLKYHHPNTELHGIELNEKSAEIAGWFGDVESLDVETLEKDEWKDSFDYIILADIVEHLKNTGSFLERMRGFLKPGGKLLISIPNVCHISNLWNMLQGEWEYRESGILDRTHLRFFTKKSFSKCLEDAGLTIQKVEGKEIVPEGYNRLIEQLTSSEYSTITEEELKAFQWLFVAER